MKNLSLEKMEKTKGGGKWDDFLGGAACTLGVIGGVGLFFASGGTAAAASMMLGGWACGGYTGYKLFWKN